MWLSCLLTGISCEISLLNTIIRAISKKSLKTEKNTRTDLNVTHCCFGNCYARVSGI